jgi:nicotinamidase-related amidase
MEIERRTPENTAIVLIDYVTGFANLFHSQPLPENIAAGIALTKIAFGYGVPLVVTAGPEQDPRGPLYPQLTEVLGDHPVVHRGGSFDAFAHPGFAEAIEATGRKHLVIAGLMSEGCILYTSLEALRRGYTVSIVVDATAGATTVIHDAAIARLTQLGVTPTSWLSFASELQVSYDNLETVGTYLQLQAYAPGFGLNLATIRAAQELGALSTSLA